MDITNLSLALGSSFTGGINLYLTLFSLGLMHRFDVLTLPSKMEVLSNPWVLGIVGLLTIVEFIVDKVPGAAIVWDYMQGPIRIPATAVMAATAFADSPTHIAGFAGLTGGVVGTTSFLGNRSVRDAAKTAPGTGLILSLGKEGLSVSLLWFVANHPYVAVGLVLVLLVICVVVICYFFRFLRRIFWRVVTTVKDPRSIVERLSWKGIRG